MKNTRRNSISKFLSVLVLVLFLTGSLAFAGGKPAPPTPTYSWSVSIPVDGVSDLQGFPLLDANATSVTYEDPTLTRNYVTIVNRTLSYFNFQIYSPLQVMMFKNTAPKSCGLEPCESMWNQIGIDPPGDKLQPDEDGSYSYSVMFGFTAGSAFDKMPYPSSPMLLNGGNFGIFDNGSDVVADNGYIHGVFPYETLYISRTNEHTWLIESVAESIDLEQMATTTKEVCNSRNKGCYNVSVTGAVAKGTAGPMKFQLTFTRKLTN
jgi:hypothetical protein